MESADRRVEVLDDEPEDLPKLKNSKSKSKTSSKSKAPQKSTSKPKEVNKKSKETNTKQEPKQEDSKPRAVKKSSEKIATEKVVTEKLLPKDKEEVSEEEDEEEEEQLPAEKTFLERTADLITSLRTVEGFKEHTGLIAFELVVDTADKKDGKQRVNLEEGMKDIFRTFYKTYRTQLLTGKLDFLMEEEYIIQFGKSGKAFIPITEIYAGLAENNPELIDTIDGNIFFLMQHACPDSDLIRLVEICEEFNPNPQGGGGGGDFLGFVGTLVNRVSGKLKTVDTEFENDKGEINNAAVGNVVADLFTDSEITGSMKNMMKTISGEDFDPNSLLKGLFNMGKNNN